MNWKPIETAPRDRLIVFAVPVFGSAHHNEKPEQFIRWDTWTDDPATDWEEERDIGWRMSDATMWAECPPAQAQYQS
jgi:hypothetical protein